MKRFVFGFLALFLCMTAVLCLVPIQAAAEEAMPGKVIMATDDSYLCVDAPATVYNASRAASVTPGKPTNLAWNTIRDWSNYPPTVMKKNGSITWNANTPFAANDENVTWFHVKVYRNNELTCWHTLGYDNAYLSEHSTLVDFDLTSPVQWETGSYYFTVQAVNDPNSEEGSSVAKSTNWSYSKPSAKLTAPSNLKWSFPSCTWTRPSGHEGTYHVEMYYSETADGEKYLFHSEWNIYDTINAPPNFVLEEGLPVGYYHFRVRSLSHDITEIQNSDWSNFKTYYYSGKTLEAPTLSAANLLSTGKIKLTWNAVDGAEKYEVYRSTSKDSGYVRMIQTTKTSVTHTGAVAGQTYYYKVRAVDVNNDKSEFSSVKSRTCKLPRPDATISVNSKGKPVIQWEPVAGAVKYQVQRAASKSGPFTVLINTTKTSVTHTGAVAGQTYYYRVFAIYDPSAANSAASPVVSCTCINTLDRPTISLSNVASSGKLKISWNAVDGADEYEVYRSSSKDSGYSKLITTSKTSVTHTGAVAGQTYYYKVKALGNGTESAFSAVKSRTCDLPRPEVTLSVNAKGKPVIQWEPIEGAVKYQVQRASSQDGPFTVLINTTKTSITHTGAQLGQTYYYRVFAICEPSAGNSAASSVKAIAVG